MQPQAVQCLLHLIFPPEKPILIRLPKRRQSRVGTGRPLRLLRCIDRMLQHGAETLDDVGPRCLLGRVEGRQHRQARRQVHGMEDQWDDGPGCRFQPVTLRQQVDERAEVVRQVRRG